MGIYTTFFVCTPPELAAAFPGWLPPLTTPVKRDTTKPFTGETTTVESREPEWTDDPDTDSPDLDFVFSHPHWDTKGLTEVELGPLADALGLEPKFEYPLYAPPSSHVYLVGLPTELVPKLVSLDANGLEAVAAKWAAAMSTPEYTHSVTGNKLNDGWTPSDAMGILHEFVTLARQASADQRLYLLIAV
ncbi:MAG TPA: hypothetical protein VHC22_00925 [Pirellulales bacterium]|nr:hypothetical protein [Pirellulales bacterium]